MAAPGTPKAWLTPSFSITSTAAWAAFILAMLFSFVCCGFAMQLTLGLPGVLQKTLPSHKTYSTWE
jgi:hypothetical protein